MTIERTNPLKVMLVGFSPVIRRGLQSFLAEDQNIKLAENADDEQQALSRIGQADYILLISIIIADTILFIHSTPARFLRFSIKPDHGLE